MVERTTVYVVRDGRFARSEVVVSAASVDRVVAAYGGGGLHGEAGLERAFGGSAYFHDDETGAAFLAVWGARNASRFRSRLRQGGTALKIVQEPPPARLTWWTARRGADEERDVSGRFARRSGELAAFLQQYARKADPNRDPNDRRYDREVEKQVKRMNPERLDRLLRDEE